MGLWDASLPAASHPPIKDHSPELWAHSKPQSTHLSGLHHCPLLYFLYGFPNLGVSYLQGKEPETCVYSTTFWKTK